MGGSWPHLLVNSRAFPGKSSDKTNTFVFEFRLCKMISFDDNIILCL